MGHFRPILCIRRSFHSLCIKGLKMLYVIFDCTKAYYLTTVCTKAVPISTASCQYYILHSESVKKAALYLELLCFFFVFFSSV